MQRLLTSFVEDLKTPRARVGLQVSPGSRAGSACERKSDWCMTGLMPIWVYSNSEAGYVHFANALESISR